MSFLNVHQTEDRLAGIGIYEANGEWVLEPPVTEDDLVHQPVETDEGAGSWLIFNQGEGLWGTILRSDDSPYNDCLPPSEQLLLNSFRRNDDVEDLLEDLYDSTSDQFLNPFYAVLGDVTRNTLAWFKGSFQSDHGQLDPGHYFLRDNVDPEKSPDDVAGDIPSDASPDLLRDQLGSGIENGRYDEYLNQDGMRSPRSMVVFRLTTDELQFEQADYSPDPEWMPHTEPTTRNT